MPISQDRGSYINLGQLNALQVEGVIRSHNCEIQSREHEVNVPRPYFG